MPEHAGAGLRPVCRPQCRTRGWCQRHINHTESSASITSKATNAPIAMAPSRRLVWDRRRGFLQRRLLPFSGRSHVCRTALDLDGTGKTSAYRLMLTDFLDYGSSLELRQEADPPGGGRCACAASPMRMPHRRGRLVSYARLDLGDPDSTARYSYQAPATASCGILDARDYSGEPPTAQNDRVCSYDSGSSTFGFVVQAAAAPLRLRRTFDAALAGQVAEIWVNGALAGRSIRGPIRRGAGSSRKLC